MAACVGIVCFDDVTGQHGGAAVCVAELQRMVDADLALAGEVRQQPHQRQRQDNQPRASAASERHEDGDRRQSRVDSPDPHHETEDARR